MEPLITRRAWLEIDLDRMAQNLAEVRRRLSPGCKVCGVSQGRTATGRGLCGGQAACARRGRFFAVATLLEGKELRDARITGEILVLSYTDPSLTSELLACDLIQSVSSPEYAAALDEAARAAGGRLKAHIKLDTGMTRTGFDCGTPEELDRVAVACRLPGLKITGTFSHFSSSDDGSEGADEYCLRSSSALPPLLTGLGRAQNFHRHPAYLQFGGDSEISAGPF